MKHRKINPDDGKTEAISEIADKSKKVRRRKKIKKKKQFSKRNKYLHLVLNKKVDQELKTNESELKSSICKNSNKAKEKSGERQTSKNKKKVGKANAVKCLKNEHDEVYDEENMEELRNSVKLIIQEFANGKKKNKKRAIKKNNKEELIFFQENVSNESSFQSKKCKKERMQNEGNIGNEKKTNNINLSKDSVEYPKKGKQTNLTLCSSNLQESDVSRPENTLKKRSTAIYNANDILQRSHSLKQRMIDHLKSSQFRYLNEQLYTTTGKEAKAMFGKNLSTFQDYHFGYQSQVAKWPINPLQVIIKDILSRPPSVVIADFGCGDATLAKSVPNKVHSFDLVALNDLVTTCNMSRVPLKNEEVDVVVFCLSLMGTNLADYIKEGHRVLKMRGTLLIAEVESRFEDVNTFVQSIQKYGFQLIAKNENYKMFVLFEFQKSRPLPKKIKCELSLKPCLYKKR